MIYDILDKVPPKGSEQRYDPNCFDQTYDYGGEESTDSKPIRAVGPWSRNGQMMSQA